ncbi:MAG: tetratricopeptide repeat protein [Deltaproteobacteria bacterium]|nr:MAG: tetratricopeptide repeat protein [Deltaproteobacteria bacterium]
MKEYNKLLQADPSDTNIRLKIGDLFMKRGETDQATRAYAQVAEQFAKTGFDAKAVAIYKQILHIDASSLNAHVKLGDLFQRMGLMSDALREFQKGIQICEERELKREAFDLLKRVASLDPGNVPNRLRLALLLAKQDLESEAREEYSSLLKEVIERDEPELIGRVCKQMLESFPDEPEAFAGLGLAKVRLGEVDEAISLLNRALPRFASDISVREALVKAYESAGDEVGVQRAYTEIAEIYKARGDNDQARAILQRFVTLDQLAEPDTAPSIILSEVLEEEQGPSLDSEDTRVAEPQPAQDADQSPEDLLAEARISFEFGDMQGAQVRLDSLLKLDPSHAEAQELLNQICGASSSGLAPEPNSIGSIGEVDDTQPSLTDTSSEFLDTGSNADPGPLPDIELVLEDDEDQDAKFASVDPPHELEEVELEIDLDASGSFEIETTGAPEASNFDLLEDSVPSEETPTGDPEPALESAHVNVDLEEAEFFFNHGMLDEAERAYRDILERAPQHPTAMLRMGELSAARKQSPKRAETPSMEPEPLVSPAPKPHKSAASVRGQKVEEESFDLAAELDSLPDHDLAGQMSGGFDEVFRAFKREIQRQIGEDESEAHYDLAIAYKEMGLLDDAVSELELVRKAGTMPLEAFAVLQASCKLSLGRPAEAAEVLEEALSSGGGDPATEAPLHYELGEALLADGRRPEALDAFRKTAAIEPDYREVSERIDQLS